MNLSAQKKMTKIKQKSLHVNNARVVLVAVRIVYGINIKTLLDYLGNLILIRHDRYMSTKLQFMCSMLEALAYCTIVS